MRSIGKILSSQVKWLMILRTVIITFLLLFTALMQIRGPQGLLPLQLVGLYILCGIAYLLTFIYSAYYQSMCAKPLFGYIQLLVDNMLISLIMIITGGVGSFFSVLFFLTTISASIMFFRKGGILVTGQASLFYMASIFIPFLYRYSPWLDLEGRYVFLTFSYVIYRGVVYMAALFVVFLLSSYLSESLRLAGEALEASESDLAELQSLNENILKSISSGLLTTDLEGRIISFNRAAEKITGWRALECIGRNLFDFVFLYDGWNPYRDPWDGDIIGHRFEGNLVDSPSTVLGMTFSPLYDDADRMNGIICAFQDLTEIKKMEDNLKRADRLAAIGELAAGMAHEIRNPLASISGSIQVLKDDIIEDENTASLMDIITREADRLNDIITDFLSFASPRPLQLEHTNLEDLLEETLTLVKKATGAKEKEYLFKVRDETSKDLALDIDRQMIKQVFWNLALNAVQAMPQGGTVTIAFKREVDDNKADRDWIIIEFSDNGGGMDAGEMEKVFSPFYSTKENGTGLGLSIVFKVIERHHGSIEIESERGEGTLFRLRLPTNLRSLTTADIEVQP